MMRLIESQQIMQMITLPSPQVQRRSDGIVVVSALNITSGWTTTKLMPNGSRSEKTESGNVFQYDGTGKLIGINGKSVAKPRGA